jgi:hypothetical protein
MQMVEEDVRADRWLDANRHEADLYSRERALLRMMPKVESQQVVNVVDNVVGVEAKMYRLIE